MGIHVPEGVIQPNVFVVLQLKFIISCIFMVQTISYHIFTIKDFIIEASFVVYEI